MYKIYAVIVALISITVTLQAQETKPASRSFLGDPSDYTPAGGYGGFPKVYSSYSGNGDYGDPYGLQPVFSSIAPSAYSSPSRFQHGSIYGGLSAFGGAIPPNTYAAASSSYGGVPNYSGYHLGGFGGHSAIGGFGVQRAFGSAGDGFGGIGGGLHNNIVGGGGVGGGFGGVGVGGGFDGVGVGGIGVGGVGIGAGGVGGGIGGAVGGGGTFTGGYGDAGYGAHYVYNVRPPIRYT